MMPSIFRLALLALVVLPSMAAAGEYLVMPGDVLRIDVAGAAGFQQTIPVELDGTAGVPLVGSIAVAGKSVHDVNTMVKERFASKSLRQYLHNGDDYLVIFDPDQVLVSISEYRPIYLSGDVVTSGEQRFRPGMTVRQGLALAGGVDVRRLPMTDPFLQAADFKADHANLWAELARERLRIDRIKSELEGVGTPPDLQPGEVPLSRNLVSELKRLESEKFDVNSVGHAKEKAFLEQSIETGTAQLELLTEQQEQEQEGREADSGELQRLLDAQKTGVTTTARVTDARRNLLLSATRHLQTTVQISQGRREQADLNRRLQKLDEDRRAALLDELQEAVVRKNAAIERIKAVSEKIAYTGAAQGSLFQQRGIEPVLTIIRNGDGGPVSIVADKDTELMPGDLVEVLLPLEIRPFNLTISD